MRSFRDRVAFPCCSKPICWHIEWHHSRGTHTLKTFSIEEEWNCFIAGLLSPWRYPLVKMSVNLSGFEYCLLNPFKVGCTCTYYHHYLWKRSIISILFNEIGFRPKNIEQMMYQNTCTGVKGHNVKHHKWVPSNVKCYITHTYATIYRILIYT